MRRRIQGFAAVAGVLALVLATAGAHSPGVAQAQEAAGHVATRDSAAEELEALIVDIEEWREAETPLPLPENAPERWAEHYTERLPDVSVERFEQERQTLEGFLARLAGIDREALAEPGRVDAAVLELQLRSRADELHYRGYLIPVGSREGFHISFASRPLESEFRSVADYDAYVAELQSFHEYARRHIELMRHGIAAGMVLPAEVLDGYEETIRVHVVDDVAESDFHVPFADLPAAITASDRERIVEDGVAAIEDSVIPGYREFLEFMVDEYVPAARETLGLTALPDGDAYYAHRIRRYTTLKMSPREIHDLGLLEVGRIRAQMTGILEQVGWEGDFSEFIEFLRTDERFYVDSEEAYLEAVALAAKRMDGALPRLFRVLPVTPYGVRAIPAFIAPRQSAGYYNHGEVTLDRGVEVERAGTININTSQLDSRPLYVVEALAFHEGVPGHHLQIMLQRESPDVSEFRKGYGVTAFTEGWGLYAERLGREVGFYTDPYSDFGRLTYEIWRAVRLVVDTGVHALGWSRQRAIDYMAANTGMALGPSTAEVDRHITEAGQGLAYKIGELRIRELRRRAEQRLGERFDLRDFHHAVLRNGSVPLATLEAQVEAWVVLVEGQES